jgi:hypothetical protein
MEWNHLAPGTLAGRPATGDEALPALRAPDEDFCNGYLTIPGQGSEPDLRMIADAGFEVAELVEA